MCGGRGTRLDTTAEKPLFEVGGRAMVDRVLDALTASPVETVFAVVSPHAPETRAHVEAVWCGANADTPDSPAVEILDAPGDGYVADLQYALDRVETPVLTVAADLPLLTGEAIDAVLDRAEAGSRTAGFESRTAGSESRTVCVPATLPRQLGATTDTVFEVDGRELVPTGVNVVGEDRGDDDGGDRSDDGDDDSSGDGDDDDGGEESQYVTHDVRFAVNVNRQQDARVAEALLGDTEP
jgi:adenosylcobinamide-phosphate guanylyltransferase